MTPDEALKLIDRIIASVNMDRGAHVRAQEAITVLNRVIISTKNESDKKEEV